MLKDFFWRIIQAKGLEEDIIFMQDGAPPHWSEEVRSWLDETWPERWMGRGSTNLPWPPCSPDLTPCDYFFGATESPQYTKMSIKLLMI